jgi:hypothetical protein
MARIMVGIPCYDKVAPEVLEDYMRFAFYLGRRYQEHEFVLGIKTKSEQFRARNSIVEGAYQLGIDYLLMIDDDHIIDWEGVNYATAKYEFLRKLIGHMEDDTKLGLVGALYYHRGGGCKPVLLRKNPDGPGYTYLTDDEITGGLQEVDVQGGGCMLIRMRALDFVGAPWFEAEIENGTDFQICQKMQKAGFKVACDTSAEIGHVSAERRVITSKNRHIVQAESTALGKQVEISANLHPIYKAYQQDIIEYLDVNYTDFLKLVGKYQDHRETFDSDNTEEYYRTGGKPYLARAAALANIENAWPAFWDDFLFRTIRTGIPAIGVDFGCGAGRMSFEFASGGHTVHFIDIEGSPTFEFLKWRIAKHKLVGIYNEWPDNSKADYVLASDVFEHLHNFDIIKTMVKCLKPGGVLLTNYMLCQDWKNNEHINNDKPGFLQKTRECGLSTINSCVYQKVAP